LDVPEFERWRAASDTAFRSAQSQRDAGFFGWACFMSEQAAQFALKALLQAAGRGDKTHDLTSLWEACRSAGIDLPPELEDGLKRLSRHYIMPRYPDVVPGGEPARFYGRADADEAIEDARRVLAEVDAAWRARGA
jgi:HEPN domain-containing protein